MIGTRRCRASLSVAVLALSTILGISTACALNPTRIGSDPGAQPPVPAWAGAQLSYAAPVVPTINGLHFPSWSFGVVGLSDASRLWKGFGPAPLLTQIEPPPPPAPIQPAPPGQPTTPTQQKIYPRKGMMITGWIMLCASYLASSLIGVIVMDQADEEYSDCGERCKRLGGYMLIPLAGPFVAIPHTKSYTGKWGMAALGVSQVAGLVLGIIGTVWHIQDKRKAEAMHSGLNVGGGWVVSVATMDGGGIPAPVLRLSTDLK